MSEFRDWSWMEEQENGELLVVYRATRRPSSISIKRGDAGGGGSVLRPQLRSEK